MAYIISADDIKKTLAGYTPEHSELFHRESTRQADKLFGQALKTRPESTVILMAGGTASGKSEYVAAYLKRRRILVLDGTMPSFEGAQIKLRKVRRAQRKVEVHLVLPASLLVAFIAFLNRDRRFSLEHFYRTHSSSRQAVLTIAQTYRDIPVRIYVSDVDFVGKGSSMSFNELIFDNRDELIDYLEKIQYTEQAIRKVVFNL